MNECNQPLFVNPQWTTAGQNQSARDLRRVARRRRTTRSRRVSPAIFVWGVGLSPRGNDGRTRREPSSTNPVDWLGVLGAWYRVRRSRPHGAADGRARLPPVPGAAVAAVRDRATPTRTSPASRTCRGSTRRSTRRSTGTPQRTIGRSGGGLPVSLNEVGHPDRPVGGRAGYTGTENGDGRRRRRPFATEGYQASWYTKMLDFAPATRTSRRSTSSSSSTRRRSRAGRAGSSTRVTSPSSRRRPSRTSSRRRGPLPGRAGVVLHPRRRQAGPVQAAGR